eukprot:scaffold3945_cov105-Isochrysis_galbana.AAC.8
MYADLRAAGTEALIRTASGMLRRSLPGDSACSAMLKACLICEGTTSSRLFAVGAIFSSGSAMGVCTGLEASG